MTISKANFLNPYSRYRGKFTPENLAFDANLQEFAQQVNIICNLENSGKITPEEAYTRIQRLWDQLSSTHDGLEVGHAG
jgi:hypothetical protein